MHSENRTVDEIRRELRAAADPAKAPGKARFFKTGEGEYGEGDLFLGVSVPAQRTIARRYKRRIDPADVAALLASPVHEERLTALFLLVGLYKAAANAEARASLVELYLNNLDRVDNWDLVDSSAHYILGARLLETDDWTLLESLARTDSLWRQRVAIISTFAFIREGRFEPTLKIAELLLDHPHDLIHKAVGWMLREVGNRDRAAEESFLKPRYKAMPRTMLRYAIEKFPEPRRTAWLKGEV